MNPVIKNLSFEQGTERVFIGDTSYDFNVQLYNSNFQNIGIKHASIVELVITDDLSSFYSSGYMVFHNVMDALESAQSISTDVRGMPEQATTGFQFRGDGRDFLVVNIAPAIEGTDHDTKIRTTGEERSKFELNYVFAINNTEDLISDTDKSLKLKKIFFNDYSYQVMNEKTGYFNTAKIAKNSLPTDQQNKRLISNEDRSITTGQAIKELITQTFTEDFNTPPTFAEDWDVGSSKIFYSSPGTNRVIDDLYYLLDYHVSLEENGFCPSILKKDRDNSWTLTPIKKFYENAYSQNLGTGGSALTENFIIVRPNAGDTPLPTGPSRAAFSVNAINLTDASYADNFEQSDMQASAQTFGMVSHAVHNYNPATKTFSIDVEDNNIDNSLTKFKRDYVQNNKGVQGNSPTTGAPTNLMTKQNLNLVNVFNPNPDQQARVNSGQNKILLNGIFNNNTVAFRTVGNTSRQTGTFVTFDRKSFSNNNPYDNKLMGTFLTVKVDHVFIRGEYFNNMVCTKTYNAEQSDSSNSVL